MSNAGGLHTRRWTFLDAPQEHDTVNPPTLARPVTLSQTPVPIQVCYIVPIDASAEMLTAIFAEGHGRWGGRDSLILPMLADGTIDEKYWAWARALDPDVVYSYVDLDIATLDRVDRELMPSVVKIHRDVMGSGDVQVRHESEAVGLSALSLLPMLANTERLGPPRRLALVSAFMDWPRDSFVTDSFGLNPYGPGWAHADIVRKYVDTLALGSRGTTQHGGSADVEVADPTALLKLMCEYAYLPLTMAQLSGTGYEQVIHRRASSWTRFNIVVGDSTLDRVSFWNGRIGVDDYQRRNIVGVRINEKHLEDPDFIAALAFFIGRWNTSTSSSGPSFATIRSSSVSADRVQPMVDALRPRNVHTAFEPFSDANDCTPSDVEDNCFLRRGMEQRYAESTVSFSADRPTHLAEAAITSKQLSAGTWAVQITMQRESSAGFGSSVTSLLIPRRWQAVRAVAEGSPAKAMLGGDLRLLARADQKPQNLSFTDDNAGFIVRLFIPYHYLTTTDPRNALPKPAVIYPQASSAGRHLHGLLRKLGTIRNAFDTLEDEFWKSVFRDMAIPREAFDDEKRAELAARLQKPISRHGPKTLTTTEDFERLADLVARIAPNLKTHTSMKPYDWFVDKYRETDECKLPKEPALTDEDIHEEVERKLRYLTAEGIFVQGYHWNCRRCLHENWSTVEAIRPSITCEVCDSRHAIPAHFSWHFLLDGYIELGLRARGLRGLVWALGTLCWSSRTFLFSPPLDLRVGGKSIGDADIACIADGKFIIGEVKESGRDVKNALGDSLIKAALLVRPDAVVVACPDAKATKRVQKQVIRVGEAVKHLGIEACAMVPSDQIGGVPGVGVLHKWKPQATTPSTLDSEDAT